MNRLSGFLFSFFFIVATGFAGGSWENSYVLAPITQTAVQNMSVDYVFEYVTGYLKDNLLPDGVNGSLVSEKLLNEVIRHLHFLDARIKPITYDPEIKAFEFRLKGKEYVLLISKRRLRGGGKKAFFKELRLEVSCVSKEKFVKNREFFGGTNLIPKIAIGKPVVFMGNGRQIYSYFIDDDSVEFEKERFLAAFEKAKEDHFDSYLKNEQIQTEFDQLKSMVLGALNDGMQINGEKTRKNVEALLIEHNDIQSSFPEEFDFFITEIINNLFHVKVSEEQKTEEIQRCNEAFNKMSEDLTLGGGAGLTMAFSVVPVMQEAVIQNIKRFDFDFPYAVYYTFTKNPPVVVKKLEPILYSEFKFNLDLVISQASKCISGLRSQDVTLELKEMESERFLSTLDEALETLEEKDSKVFSFIRDFCNAFRQNGEEMIREKGYKSSFVTGYFVKEEIKRLQSVGALEEVQDKEDALKKFGETLLEIFIKKEEAIDIPDEDFVLFIRNLDTKRFHDLVEVHKDKIKAIVSTEVTSTAHWAIMAGQMGIPVVQLGRQYQGDPVKNVFSVVSTKQFVCVDGLKGQVIIDPDDARMRFLVNRKAWIDSVYQYFLKNVTEAVKIPLKIGANLDAELPVTDEEVGRIKAKDLASLIRAKVRPMLEQYGATSIGLVRTEYLYMLARLLTEEELVAFFEELGNLVKGPVIVRGFDYEPDKIISAVQALYEEAGLKMPKNLYGAKYYYKDAIGRKLIKAQLRAVYKAFLLTGNPEFQFMFPMVSNREDITELLKIKEEVMRELYEDKAFLAKWGEVSFKGNINEDRVFEKNEVYIQAFVQSVNRAFETGMPVFPVVQDLIKLKWEQELAKKGIPENAVNSLVSDMLKMVEDAFADVDFLQKLKEKSGDGKALVRMVMSTLKKFEADTGRLFSEMAEEPFLSAVRLMPVGSMVETVQAVMNIDAILEQFDFVSIGTNDLIKNVFNADRENPADENYFSLLQPEVLGEIREVFKAAIKHKKRVSVCGELARNLLFMFFVLNESESFGEEFFRYVSLSISHINLPEFKEMLRRVDPKKLKMAFRNWESMEPEELTRKTDKVLTRIMNQIKRIPEVLEQRQKMQNEFRKQNRLIDLILKRNSLKKAA